jgi:hypothetical protein
MAGNSLIQELEAMAALGQVLGDLTDLAARQRVLEWAARRFAVEGVVTPEPSAPQLASLEPLVNPLVNDPALAVDSLSDMFVACTAADPDDDLREFGAPDETPASAPDEKKLPLEVVLRSFAADFQRLAEEWNGATI